METIAYCKLVLLLDPKVLGLHPRELLGTALIDLPEPGSKARIENLATKVRGQEDITKVGTISANGNEEIGELLAEALQEVGTEGVVEIEEGKSLHTEKEVVEGMQFDKGFLSPYFSTKADSMEAVLEDCYVLIHEKKKHDLLDERDTKARDEAASLGLTKDFQPILATPIGGELTRQEEQWNQREKKEVVKLKERNLRTLKEFRNGEKLRAWERKNLEEDFKLKWDEKEEVHTLNIEQTFYNSLLLQASQGAEINQQDIMAKFAEINKQNQLIKIKYRKVRQQNNIKRREEKKKILSQ